MKKGKILSFACLPMVMAMLASCGHEHTFDEKWSYDENKHWHTATCEHHGEKSEVGDHEYGDDTICDVCGYDSANPTPTPIPHEHNFTGEYQKDDTGHWQVCACGEAGPKEAHTFVNDVCSVCGYGRIVPPAVDYKVTADEWEAASHSEKPFMFADNYKADCTFTTGSGDETTVTTINIEVDGTKAKISSNIENTKYFSLEESVYYIYSTSDGETFVKNDSIMNPILRYYGMLEPFGDSSAFTLDDTAQCYKAESLMEGLYSNACIYFINKQIVKFDFNMYMDSQRLTLTHVVINATYGGQVVELPEVSPAVEPVYAYTVNGSSFACLAKGKDPNDQVQWEALNIDLAKDDTIGFANVSPASPEYLAPLTIGEGYNNFSIEGGVLTANEDGNYSFYVHVEYENNIVYIVKNDAATMYQILLNDNPINLIHNETPQDPSYDEWFVTGVSIASGTTIKVRDTVNVVDFYIALDEASVPGFDDDGDKITCTQDGVYDLYLKIKYEDNKVYIGNTAK